VSFHYRQKKARQEGEEKEFEEKTAEKEKEQTTRAKSSGKIGSFVSYDLFISQVYANSTHLPQKV